VPSKRSEQPDFETSLHELEQLVTAMEKGDMSLEESLKTFERGVELTRFCRDTLKQAEQRVAILNQESDQLEPFDNDA
jgi:exodeoxyribonuclease VII small subunit